MNGKYPRRRPPLSLVWPKVADYAIGDVQGCYKALQRLLEQLHFDDKRDRLWFVGDLVNRGPQSLEVLRFIKNLANPAKITLGNHDLHLLSKLFGRCSWANKDDTLDAFLAAHDREDLGHWLRKQSLLIYDKSLNLAMCHAGIAPMWTLSQALNYANELESILAGEAYADYLSDMYSNEPACWQENLTGISRLRLITNYFTRMRFCDRRGCLVLNYKGALAEAPQELIPWYEVPKRKPIPADIIFGHWAALQGKCPIPNIYAIDTGCVWGGKLTALRLQDKKRFSVTNE